MSKVPKFPQFDLRGSEQPNSGPRHAPWILVSCLMAALAVYAAQAAGTAGIHALDSEQAVQRLAAGLPWLVAMTALVAAALSLFHAGTSTVKGWSFFGLGLCAAAGFKLWSAATTCTATGQQIDTTALAFTAVFVGAWLALLTAGRTEAPGPRKTPRALLVAPALLLLGGALCLTPAGLVGVDEPLEARARALLPFGVYLLFALTVGPLTLRTRKSPIAVALLAAAPVWMAVDAATSVLGVGRLYSNVLVHAVDLSAYVMLCAAYCVDAAQRARQSRELLERARRSAARTEALLEVVADGILLTNGLGRIQSVNRAAQHVFGYTPENLRAHNVSFLIPSLSEHGRPEDGQRIEGVGLRRDGSKFPVSVVAREIEHVGGCTTAWVLSDLTDLKSAEKERDRFFSLSPIAMFVAELGGPFRRVNPAFKRLLGYAEHEVRDRTFFDLVHPEDRERTLEALSNLRRGKIIQDFETRLRARDGGTRWFSWSVGYSQGDDRIYAVGIEFTERKRMESELRAAWRYARDLFELNPNAIVVLDRAGCIQDANATAAELLGPRSQYRGRELASCFVHQDELREVLARIPVQGSIDNHPLVFFGSNQVPRQIRMNACVFRDRSGEVQGTLAVLRDVSKEMELEIQLQRAQKMESIGQLAAGIAHEINTPTQYVMDNVCFLADAMRELGEFVEAFDTRTQQEADAEILTELRKVLDDLDAEYLLQEIPRAIQSSTEGLNRVARIVRAMKEFSHPGQASKTDVDINHAIQNTVTVSHNALKYVAEVELELDPELPLVPCNEGEFNQAVLNLLINAGQAIEENTQEDEELQGQVTVRTRYADGWVEIQVADNGPGIPEENWPRVFDPFFTTKEVGKGTGQGLALVYSVVVEKHDGELSFESSPAGTTFLIRLPLTVPVEEAA